MAAGVNRSWQLKTYLKYKLVKYTLHFLPGRTPRVGVVNMLTAQVKGTDFYSICLSCAVSFDTTSFQWHKECVYTGVWAMVSCFTTTHIGLYEIQKKILYNMTY